MEHATGGYRGRPYGGVSIICRNNPHIVYNEVEILSDRVVAITVSNANSIMCVIVSAYLPFFKHGDLIQTDLFVETVDALQCLVDKYSAACPVYIMGDLNVQLPRNPAGNTWYRRRGFNEQRVMYDFIIGNDMVITDHVHSQNVQYTYFCDSNNTRTWIDHCISPASALLSMVKSCRILPYEPSNVSDHLPITIKLHLPYTCPGSASEPGKSPSSAVHAGHSIPKWDNDITNIRYSKILEQKLVSISPLNIDVNSWEQDLQTRVDSFVDELNGAIHTSAKEAGCVVSHKFTPKPYWCPELSVLNDRKRFWWRLWVQNGRPRSGWVFQCWKGVKKLFRKTSRWYSNNVSKAELSRLLWHFKQKNMNSFWNIIKRRRRRAQAKS